MGNSQSGYGWAIIQQITSYQRMRGHFAQTLPFPKKDTDLPHRVDQFRKTNTSPLDQTTKKSSFYADDSTLKTEINQSFKTQGTITEHQLQQKQPNSHRNIQNPSKVCKFNPFSGKEKKPQPPKLERSPQRINVDSSPHHLNQSKTIKDATQMRSTLKNLLQPKGLSPCDRSFQKQQPRIQSPKPKLNSSINISRCFGEKQTSARKSTRLLQKENQILRQENQLLKHQMAEIKKHILSVSTYKKEETISNLRDTIKKEDNEIKELRLKLEIANKKVYTLNTLIANKDEEIEFLSLKIAQLQTDIIELKQKNVEKIEHLKEKMMTVLEGYAELEQKFNAEEQEWLAFTQKWIQEKSMYTHRISFLQSYISNNH